MSKDKGALTVEEQGIDTISEEERKGTPASLFWPWFAANISVFAMSYGAWALGFGISFWQATIMTTIGVVVSFLLVGVISIAGKRGNAPTMVLTRATFGVEGAKVPAALSWIATLGWEISLELAIPQTIVSAYMHGCAFLTITKDAEGVIVTPSGIQCRHLGGRHNRLAAVLTINDVTSKGRITAFNVFFPNTLLPIQLGGIVHRDDPRRLRRRRKPQGAIGGELRIGHAHHHPAVQRIRGIRACCFRPKRERDRAQRRHHVRHHQANRPVTTVRMERTIRQHQPDLSGQHRHLPGRTNRCQRIRSHGWPRAYRQT